MSEFQAPAIDFRIPDWVDDRTREELERVAGLACHLAGALAQDWSDPDTGSERLANAIEEIDRSAFVVSFHANRRAGERRGES